MDNVEVKGELNANAFFQTLAAILSRKYGVKVTLKSCEKAEAWRSTVHRVHRERDSA